MGAVLFDRYEASLSVELELAGFRKVAMASGQDVALYDSMAALVQEKECRKYANASGVCSQGLLSFGDDGLLGWTLGRQRVCCQAARLGERITITRWMWDDYAQKRSE